MNELEQKQDAVLSLLSGKIDDYYLAGGTALARFYFHHRESADLDFFTKHYDINQIAGIMNYLSTEIGIKADLLSAQTREKFAKVAVYTLPFSPQLNLKIDFVEDVIDLLSPFKVVNGIKIMAIEDIYLRKIYAVIGTVAQTDSAGRNIGLGGRNEAKDFFDLYFLSSVFRPLSEFVGEYGRNDHKEGLIRWFRTHNRLEIKTGLLEIITQTPFDYQIMEKHFKNEIDKIIEKELS